MSSAPPPSSAPPGATPARLVREIELPLEAPRKGLRGRLGGARPGMLRLRGSELALEHPGSMARALTLPAGVVTVAAVDLGSTDRQADHGRFVILRRISPTQVVPREHGIEGWLWTSRQGAALPSLVDGETPNVALLFAKPLDEEVVASHFRPEWVRALAERSPLGRPAIPGLLIAVQAAWQAEEAFRQFGVLSDLTDREVPPAMRRSLPTDKPANQSFTGGVETRASTSFAPPGAP